MLKSLVVATACLPLLAAAAVYRWVDADGVVHFSQSAPVGQGAERIQPDVPPPTSAPAQKGMVQFSRTYEAQQTRQDKVREVALKRKAQRAEACAKARDRVSALEAATAHRLFVPDPGGGRHRMTEPEFERHLAAAQAQIKASCPD